MNPVNILMGGIDTSLHILSYLEEDDLLQTSYTCRQLHQIVEEANMLWTDTLNKNEIPPLNTLPAKKNLIHLFKRYCTFTANLYPQLQDPKPQTNEIQASSQTLRANREGNAELRSPSLFQQKMKTDQRLQALLFADGKGLDYPLLEGLKAKEPLPVLKMLVKAGARPSTRVLDSAIEQQASLEVIEWLLEQKIKPTVHTLLLAKKHLAPKELKDALLLQSEPHYFFCDMGIL